MNSGTAASAAIVDVCGLHYNLAGWEAYLMAFAEAAPGYLRKFGPRFCAIAGADFGGYRERIERSPRDAVKFLIDAGGGFDESFESYEARMRRQGVSHQILHGWAWHDRNDGDLNQYIAACAAKAPDLFSAWAHVRLDDPEASARRLEVAVKEWGVSGLTLIPFLDGRPISDAACRPVLDKARELSLPIWLHGGQNFNNHVSLDISDVRHIDRVAAAYPELVILIGHGGWPWVAEAVAMCQRHDKLYIEFSSHRPAHMPRSGSGWEAMLAQASASMRDRVMFGASGWVSPKSVAELARETSELPIKPEVAQAWLGRNAERALGLRLAQASA